MKNCWLVKQEPETYAFVQFAREKETLWEGVRNYQARNNLRAMKNGDKVLFYESGGMKAIVGTATVDGSPVPDPSATEGDWTAVLLRAGNALKRPVTLSEVKADKTLSEMVLARNSRLSVMPVTPAQYAAVISLSGRSS